MKNIATGLIAGLMALAMGCNSSSHHETSLRVIHASPDAPKVNVKLNGNERLKGVDYGISSNFLTLPEGSYQSILMPICPVAERQRF
ncbi:DUF4397 domain-containing protein [Veronia nyctiphanis]|nr:DUF4397 domain-containing protein [Veronia nyctiphanis]